jgi:glycosyltransferase involved in cell wall biosynthesis
MISIITPVYNGERFIEKCIQVVIEQHCPDIEHIIIDGGSKDRTIEIIKKYAQKYSHIQWISEKDKGQSDAMNKGIKLAKGDILSILNVDDYYERNVLNRVTEIFQTLPKPSFVAGNCNIWGDEGKLIEVNKPSKLEFIDLLLGPGVNPFPMNPSAYFYHTCLHEKIGLYQVDEDYAMDVDFLLRAVQVAKLKYVDETWGNYRKFEGTKTVNDIASGQNMIRVHSLMQFHRRKLPLLQRWYVSVCYTIFYSESFNKIFYSKQFNRIKYFLHEPQELPVSIHKKIRKVLASVL